ncbi:MAG: MoaD/ThiS family protein [Hydrogenophilaceae bacterium]|nr:MoaD/ThiS family protein [Hydrogenophilaceae bacterium]
MIRILYFGSLVDAFDRASDEIDLPANVQDIQSLMFYLSLRGEIWARYLRNNPGLKITVNRTFAEGGTPVKDGDEIAFVALG